MSNFPPFSRIQIPFAVIAAGTVGLFLGVGYLGQPTFARYFQHQGAVFAAAGSREDDNLVALADYYLAHASDIANPTYRIALANTYVKRGNLQQAADSLGTTATERLQKAELQLELGQIDAGLLTLQPLSDAQANVARSRLYLEGGRIEDAITAVSEPHSAAERMQYVLSTTIDDKGALAAATLATAPIAEQPQLQQAMSGNLSLAQALLKGHLYRTAQQVAENSPESSQKYLLLGSLLEARVHTSKSKQAAVKQAYQKGIALDPSNIELRQKLHDVLIEQKDQAGARAQQEVMERLRSGNL